MKERESLGTHIRISTSILYLFNRLKVALLPIYYNYLHKYIYVNIIYIYTYYVYITCISICIFIFGYKGIKNKFGQEGVVSSWYLNYEGNSEFSALVCSKIGNMICARHL